MMRELDEENAWKLSVRSKIADFDAHSVASFFDGGGHKAAAGCRIDGSQKEVEAKLVRQLKIALD